MAGGTPTLTLNDGGTATYTGGSGTNALTFSYTVGAGQNTAGLAATAVNLNSATITDGAGNAANLSLTGLTQSGPQIDTTTPTITSLWSESPCERRSQCRQDRHPDAEPERGGDGGRRHPDADPQRRRHRHLYRRLRHQCADLQLHGGAGQNTAGLAATAVNLNAATITDGAGNAANLSLTGLTQSGPQIDTTTPTITLAGRVARKRRSQCRQDRHADAEPERGGDGGGRHADADPQRRRHRHLYRRLRHQCADLQLHGRRRTEHRGPGGHRGQSQLGDRHRRRRQCRQSLAHRPDPERPADRHHDADDHRRWSESPASGDLNAGKTVTLTLNLSEAVTVAGGTPTLTLNDGGTATYTGGSGTNALTFSYTVGAGQNTADLAATAVNLNCGDHHGRRRQCRQPLAHRPDPDRPADRHHDADGHRSTGRSHPASGDLNAGKTVTLTLNLSEAVTVDAGGTPTLTLNDGGTATYTGGSGTSALTFSYTVAAGQNTPDLAATAVNLNARDHHGRRRQCRQPLAAPA